jgi:hypothetical protein
MGLFDKLFGGRHAEKLPAISFRCIHCRTLQMTQPLDGEFNYGRCSNCDAGISMYPNISCGGCQQTVVAITFTINDEILLIPSAYQRKSAIYSSVVICNSCGHLKEWNGNAHPREILSTGR